MDRAIAYDGSPDRWGNWPFTLFWIQRGGWWGDGPRIRAQGFCCRPERFEGKARLFGMREHDKALAYLQKQLAPDVEQLVCQRCGMSKEVHTAPHEFTLLS
jgi:hypothetical protein